MMPRPPYDPFEVMPRVHAVREFCAWFFGDGDAIMPKEKQQAIIEEYWIFVASQRSTPLRDRVRRGPAKMLNFPGARPDLT